MIRAAVAAGLVAVITSCAPGGRSAPSPGPGGGPVDVRVDEEPAPGARVVLDLDADGEGIGSACATVDRWVDGGWRATWWYVRSSPAANRVPETEEVACPAMGIALPTRMEIEVPAEIGSGTWRIAWVAGEDAVGAYVFEV